MARLIERLRHDPSWHRMLGSVIVVAFVLSSASVGQIRHRLDARNDQPSFVEDGDPGPYENSSPSPRASASRTAAVAPPGTPGAPGSGGTKPPVLKPGDIGSTFKPKPGQVVKKVPDFGLRTQGVTATTVKLGISWNRTACGDAGFLEAAVGAGATGDYEKAMTAFTRYINENGGIAGRQLEIVKGDDGGGGCAEKALSAARKLVDDDKVFAVIPGLHDVADYAASKNIPTFIGRDDPESLKRYGANGLGLTQEIAGVMRAWAAFGRYYIETHKHKACLVRPENDESGNWDLYSSILVKQMAAQKLTFTEHIAYATEVETAQAQAAAAMTKAKDAKCDQVYLLMGNPIGAIFMTQAATQANYHPAWTFTSYTALADSELGGRLQDQGQWERAVGLSTRIKPGAGHPKEGNCKKIYEKYYPNDGQSESAATQVYCALILSAAEIMARGVILTGDLTANGLLLGANSIRGDFYYDATVPLSWKFPSPDGPFKTKGFSHYTVVDWSSSSSAYLFPEFPKYWEEMEAGRGGSIDIRSTYK